jgi:hypothetical protein
MNQKNLDFLKDQLKYAGFGEDMEAKLKSKMAEQKPEFTLTHQVDFGKDSTLSTLHFRKSEQSDMYFFNSYNVALKKMQDDAVMKQTFYINKGNNITLKEAFNLMSGRSVNKELTNKDGQTYNAWVQLNFKETDPAGNFKVKQYHENYGFDLKEALRKLPIVELKTEKESSDLIRSLQKGNKQSATLQMDGTTQKVFIEANPQFKTLIIYDQNANRIRQGQTQEQQPEGTKVAAKQAAKPSGSDEGDEGGPAAKKPRKKKLSV